MRTLQVAEQKIWNIVQAVRQLVEGRRNSVGTVTLRANQTTTTVVAQTCGTSSKVFLMPHTASAAAAVWYIAQADILLGTFTITHDLDPALDRTFGYDVGGG